MNFLRCIKRKKGNKYYIYDKYFEIHFYNKMRESKFRIIFSVLRSSTRILYVLTRERPELVGFVMCLSTYNYST